MIKITAKVDETGTSVQMKELSGKLDDILDETAGIVAAVVGNILANGQPEGVRPKEFEAFIMQQINKRTKESLGSQMISLRIWTRVVLLMNLYQKEIICMML